MQKGRANQLFTRMVTVTMDRCVNYIKDFCSSDFEREATIFLEHDVWLLLERKVWS